MAQLFAKPSGTPEILKMLAAGVLYPLRPMGSGKHAFPELNGKNRRSWLAVLCA